jgi:serine/threonine protein kinase/tetratricopeptide (TPR) repeat protein
MVARHISKYKIREKLGEGGMGVVYMAEDTRLKRAVALKFLHPDAFGSEEDKQRFIREAQIGASLDHPNICTVYEIDERDGEVFIAVAFIEGVSLDQKIRSGPLDIAEAVRIAIQIARGLSAAHEKGIVHRDIKSSNILLTNDGLVKITDFGLAKVVDDGETVGRVMAGSTAYMSPEQARADEVDLRTDIWSLGVVLFEMLTGVLPFRGDFEAALMYSILNEEPRHITGLRPAVPIDLKRVISRMLAKDPDGRFRSAEEVRAALVEVKRVLEDSAVKPPADAKPSIAVLPFVDMSPDGDQEYFCDGIAEEITSALTKLEGLRVVARTSAFSFKGKNVSIPDIGMRLGVETLLEGSVRKAGNRLRIAVQLTNAADGYDLWSEQYDREFEDIFAIQDEIRLAIVDQMKVTLLHEDRAALVKRYTVDPEAYSLYLKGRFFWSKRTEDGYRKALDYFKQAIDQDPAYALAYVGIADCYDLLGWYDYLAPEKAFPKARAAAHKAMEMDERLAEAHATAGWICANYDWSWSCAETNYNRALELNPGYATAHQWYAEYLSYMGRHEEAIRHAEQAVQLDPLSIIINCDLGQVLYYAREYDRAIEQLGRTLEMEAGFSITHYFLAFAYLQRRNHTEALQSAQRALDLSGGEGPLNVAQLGLVHAFAGHVDDARAALQQLSELSTKRYVSPFSVALVHMGLGRIDEAFDWLNKAYDARDHWLETLKVHPVLDTLRVDPQYEELLARMKLEA